jgi:hypothetical protein
MKTYEITLPGFDIDNCETDHLVIWINAPDPMIAYEFAKSLNADCEELLRDREYSFEDGVDFILDENGVVHGN